MHGTVVIKDKAAADAGIKLILQILHLSTTDYSYKTKGPL